MQEFARELAQPAAIAAMYSNLAEYYRFLGRSPHVGLQDSHEIGWIITGIQDAFLNAIFQTRLSPGDADEAISKTLSRFKCSGVPFLWMGGPEVSPADLGERLESLGLSYCPDWCGMSVDISRSSVVEAPPVSIRHVQDNDSLQSWVRVYTFGFNISAFRERYFAIEAGLGLSPGLPRQHLLGLQQGQPVAAATLFLGSAAAGLYNIATIPEFRRRGIATAMAAACLRRARSAGYRLAVLHASAMGSGLYRRLGFQSCGSLEAYRGTGR